MTGPAEAAVGDALPTRTHVLTQADLIRYAGASGDLNPLHWDPEVAARVSPTGGVIAHGMLNLGLVSALLTSWAGGPQRLRSLDVAFRKPCPVGATVTVGGRVRARDDAAGTVTVEVWVSDADGARIVDRRRSTAVVAVA